MTETMGRLSGRAAEKIWLKSYPDSVPAEIAPHAHASLGAQLLQGFGKVCHVVRALRRRILSLPD